MRVGDIEAVQNITGKNDAKQYSNRKSHDGATSEVRPRDLGYGGGWVRLEATASKNKTRAGECSSERDTICPQRQTANFSD
jgi:hypothetical protein